MGPMGMMPPPPGGGGPAGGMGMAGPPPMMGGEGAPPPPDASAGRAELLTSLRDAYGQMKMLAAKAGIDWREVEQGGM